MRSWRSAPPPGAGPPHRPRRPRSRATPPCTRAGARRRPGRFRPAPLPPASARTGAFRGMGGRAAAVAGYAATEIAVPFVLIPVGEQRIASSVTAILIAAMPLTVALLSVWLIPLERPGGRRLIGLFIGLFGVVAL